MDSPEYREQLQVLNQFLGKSDGKDKLCATIQYVCLFVSAGKPGSVQKIQASIAAARKVFRVLKPLETVTPLILKPGFDTTSPILLQALTKIKSLCMAGYLAFDHVAWMGQAGLVTDSSFLKSCQKISLFSWFAGLSLMEPVSGHQCYVVSGLLAKSRLLRGEDVSTQKLALEQQIRKQLLILLHSCLQAVLAMGLLEFTPMNKRSVGLIGTVTSALNCYMLYPSPSPEKDKKA